MEKTLSQLTVGDSFTLKYDLIRTEGGFSYKVKKSDRVYKVSKVNRMTIKTECGVNFKFASAGTHWRSNYDNGSVQLVK